MENQPSRAKTRERIGILLRSSKALIVVEIAALFLILAAWDVLSIPRTIVPLLLLGWLSLWLRGMHWKDVGLRRPDNWLFVLATGIGIAILTWVIGYSLLRPALLRLTGEPSTDPRDFSWITGNLPVFLATLVLQWLLAAIAEEAVYRGYLLNRLVDLLGDSASGWGVGIVVSALMFSIGHGVYQPAFMLTSFLSGVINGGAYLIGRRNLWLPIIVHGMSNTIGFTLVFLGLVGQ